MCAVLSVWTHQVLWSYVGGSGGIFIAKPRLTCAWVISSCRWRLRRAPSSRRWPAPPNRAASERLAVGGSASRAAPRSPSGRSFQAATATDGRGGGHWHRPRPPLRARAFAQRAQRGRDCVMSNSPSTTAWMNSRTRSRRPASIGSNQLSKRWTAALGCDCSSFMASSSWRGLPALRSRRESSSHDTYETIDGSSALNKYRTSRKNVRSASGFVLELSGACDRGQHSGCHAVASAPARYWHR